MMKHYHRVQETKHYGFTSPVVDPISGEDRRAHGAATLIDRCACGAQRKRNCNGRHTETGRWEVQS